MGKKYKADKISIGGHTLDESRMVILDNLIEGGLHSEAGYISSFTDTNTHLTDAEIAAMGYIKTYTDTDTNTQLSDAQIAEMGYIKTYTDTNTNTQLTSAQIAAMGYLSTATGLEVFRSEKNIDDQGTYMFAQDDGGWTGGARLAGAHNGYGVISMHLHTGGYYGQIHLSSLTGDMGIRFQENSDTWGSIYTVHTSKHFSTADVADGKTAHGWGNHASAGYLTSYNDTNTWRGIHDTPVDGETAVSISSNWAFDNVKTAVPAGALFTDTNTTYDLSGYISKGSTITPGASWTTATKFKSSGDIGQGAGNHSLQILSDINNDAFMAFHISSDYAIHFGLDNTSNRLYTGGWSDGTGTKYQLYDSRDFSTADVAKGVTAHGWSNHADAGYLTALPSHNHDDRYYTEAESNSRFINVTGDTMSGSLDVNADIQANTFTQAAHGIPRNNLGAPTVTEMALFDNQFTPKTTLANNYDDLTDLTFWVQTTSSSAWTEITTFSDDQKRKFLRTNNSNIAIPNGVYKLRVEFVGKGYTFANAMYAYWSSNSHNTQVHVWKYNVNSSSWLQHTNSSATISSWPGHMYLPFGTIPWHETTTTSTGHFKSVRIEFTPTWSTGTYSDRVINLYGMQVWGGYPSGRRTPHYYDQNGRLNVTKELSVSDNIRTPLLYDSNDTSYYLDPASSSNLFSVSAQHFYGNLTGNASTATLAATATTANLIKVNDYAGTTNMRILGSHQTGGSDNVYSNASMYLNCDTGIINATGFVGDLTGNASSATIAAAYLPLSGGTLTGDITVGSGKTSSNIYMADSDGTARRIHTNSNRIGFLTSGNGWGSYCTNNGDWTTDMISYAGASMRAPVFYDSNDTNYYLNPASTSNLNIVQAVQFQGSLAGTASNANTLDSFSSESFLRSDGDDTVNGGVTYTWTRTDTAGIVFVNNTYNTQLAMGGWTTANSSNVSRIRTSSGNLHIDSASNGNTYLNWYSGGDVKTNSILQSDASLRAPIFYDSNNTSYYVHADSTTQLNHLSVNSTFKSRNFTAGSLGYQIENRNADGATFRFDGDTFIFHGGGGVGNVFEMNQNGDLTARTSLQAPIFYDSNNTGYYVDPASTSSLNELTVNGTIAGNISGNANTLDNIDSGSFLRSDATDYQNNTIYQRGYLVNETGYRNRGVYGNYSSTKTNHIWSMGTAYKNHASGTNFGNLYGLAYKHTNNTTGGSMAGGHQMVWCSNGTGRSAMGDNIWTSGNVKAPIFYDSNNTTYYTNPASDSIMNRVKLINNTTPIIIKANSSYKSWVHHIASDDTYVFAPSTADGGETWDWDNQMSINTSGVVKANNFVLRSDERSKTKIKNLTRDNIDVSWKSFEMKGNEGEYRTGVIAQELEETHPEFVNTDSEGFKSVKYIDLLIAKIAELEARLEKLEK